MRLRTIISSILAACAMGLSPLALATPDLIVHNNTDFYSTTLANNGACSSNFPQEKGITPPHTTKSIDGRIVRAACLTNSDNCKADVYLTNNCKGPIIATVIFSVNTGIKSKNNIPNSGYCLRGAGFDVTLDPNPTNQPCE